VTLPPGVFRNRLMSWLLFSFCRNRVGDAVVDGRADEDDPVLQQPTVDVVLAFAPAGLLDDERDDVVVGDGHGSAVAV
jgi:hypothetical protein